MIPKLSAFQVHFLKDLARGKTKAIVACGSAEGDKEALKIEDELSQVKELVALKLVVEPDEGERENVIAIARKHVGDNREIYPVIITVKGQMMFEKVKHGKFVN